MGQYRDGQLFKTYFEYKRRGRSTKVPVFGFVAVNQDGPYIEPLLTTDLYDILRSMPRCMRPSIIRRINESVYRAAVSLNRIS